MILNTWDNDIIMILELGVVIKGLMKQWKLECSSEVIWWLSQPVDHNSQI